MLPRRELNASPVTVVAMPPASWTISAPAEMSQGFSRCSQKPSSRAGRDVAEIDRRRPEPPHGARDGEEVPEEAH